MPCPALASVSYDVSYDGVVVKQSLIFLFQTTTSDCGLTEGKDSVHLWRDAPQELPPPLHPRPGADGDPTAPHLQEGLPGPGRHH